MRTILASLWIMTCFAPGALAQNIRPDEVRDAKETELEELDLSPETIRFTAFSTCKGRSMALRVERRVRSESQTEEFDWKPIAVLKTKSGSTNPAGEVAVYRLSRYLEVPIVPVCVPRYLSQRVMQ